MGLRRWIIKNLLCGGDSYHKKHNQHNKEPHQYQPPQPQSQRAEPSAPLDSDNPAIPTKNELQNQQNTQLSQQQMESPPPYAYHAEHQRTAQTAPQTTIAFQGQQQHYVQAPPATVVLRQQPNVIVVPTRHYPYAPTPYICVGGCGSFSSLSSIGSF